ncbi:MAG: transcriptional coactivator p15/PC4 family protein, partial [Nitrospinae bacterium]|nr:transcriptional coactivator p15/PC4 family protein [Nitrospinota bacterium]
MDKIIAELPKGPLDKLALSLQEYQGHPFVDIRLYFLGDDEQWHPTKRG